MHQFRDKSVAQRELVSRRPALLPGAAGRRRARLPRRRGAGRRGPARAPRAHARRRAALQRALRRGACSSCPSTGSPRSARGSWTCRTRRGRCRRPAAREEGTVYVLDEPKAIEKKIKRAVTDSGTRDPPRPGQARRHEPHRHPRGARGVTPDEVEADMARRARLRRPQGRRRPRRSSRCSRRCASATQQLRADEAALEAMLAAGRGEGPRDRAPTRSPTCASAMGVGPAAADGSAMRRLVALVGAVVLVDTMFYAAITPLLPELVRPTSALGKTAPGCSPAPTRSARCSARCRAGWLARPGGRTAAVLDRPRDHVGRGPGLRVRRLDRGARRRPAPAGRRRRVLVGGRDGLAGERGRRAERAGRGDRHARWAPRSSASSSGPVLGHARDGDRARRRRSRSMALLGARARRLGADEPAPPGAAAAADGPAVGAAPARASASGSWLTVLPRDGLRRPRRARAAAAGRARRERPGHRRHVLRGRGARGGDQPGRRADQRPSRRRGRRAPGALGERRGARRPAAARRGRCHWPRRSS